MRSAEGRRAAIAYGSQATLAQQAYASLTERIVTLQIKPETLVSEGSLSALLGVGRTPIREALRELARDHLVTILPKRGIIVTPVDPHGLLLLLEARRCLERVRVTRAASRSGPAERRQFGVFADQLERAAAAGDVAIHTRIDQEFDDLVDRCAANPFVSDALRPLHNVVRRFWITQAGTETFHEITDLHCALVRAIGSGSPEAAAEACATMLDYNEKVLRKLLD